MSDERLVMIVGTRHEYISVIEGRMSVMNMIQTTWTHAFKEATEALTSLVH